MVYIYIYMYIYMVYEAMVYTHIYLEYYSAIKEWNSAICNNMDGPRRYYA